MRDHDVLTAVRALAPALRARADQAEELRRTPTASIDELAGAGFFRLLRPPAYGGLAAAPDIFHAAVHEISRACGSTGWATAVLGVHPWYVAQLDPRAQHDVWGDDDSALICSSHAPTGTVTPVDGGYRLAGRWHYAAGAPPPPGAPLGGHRSDAARPPPDKPPFLVPRTDYRVDDVWDTVGLRGSGSNDLVVDDAFVPAHRTLGYAPVTALRCPGHEVNPEPVYRLPYAALFTTTISTVMVGIAEGAYEHHVTAARANPRLPHGRRVAEDPFAQVRIARAAGEIDAARLQLTRNTAELYEVARAGREPSRSLRARARRDQALATERAITAVDLLRENAGGSPLRSGGDVLARAWRDLHTGRGQAANDVERALALFGRDAVGLDVQDPML
ncbi:3-hydroxy-9,10-secoandrosta-1,3,5(10)-triene-9,17-dione monooxygenase oxygenase subunit [Streptomyces sp. NPDC058527]|uniref:3-hydroxy-9,10-secoandrosta-1,3,5(10)-triene-9, 17-dione monooxygenase oxygenase subunit n=1 Tax=Streptomyces sp. NPDC058527 TaxID=3346539 RepID=UPI0036592CA9